MKIDKATAKDVLRWYAQRFTEVKPGTRLMAPDALPGLTYDNVLEYTAHLIDGGYAEGFMYPSMDLARKWGEGAVLSITDKGYVWMEFGGND